MERDRVALKRMLDDYNCSQAVLSVFGPVYGIDEGECVAIASAFGAGMGCSQQTCGAVTGALMALGLRHMGKGLSIVEAKKEAYADARLFFQLFSEAHGSTICREILGWDITTEEGMKEAREKGLFREKCAEFVASAVRIVEEISGM